MSTYYGCRDSGEGVVVMINSENWTIIDEIVNSVATVYNWKDFYLPEVKKAIDLPDTLIKKYVDKYQMGLRGFEIVTEAKGLGMKAAGDIPWILYFTSDSDFFVKENRGMVKFEFAPDGKVTGFITNGMKAKKTD